MNRFVVNFQIYLFSFIFEQINLYPGIKPDVKSEMKMNKIG